jgi:HEAT repeat protein
MRRSRLFKLVIGLAIVGYLAISVYTTRAKWLPWIPGVATKLEPRPDPIVDGRQLQDWIKDLSDPNPDVRRLAAETLGDNGKFFPRADKVVEALGKLLHDPDVEVRAAAVAAFGKVHLWAQTELSSLLEIAQGDDEDLRAGAVKALVPFIDTQEQIEHFFRAALQDKNPEARDLIFGLLVEAAPRSAGASALVTGALRSEDEDLRLRALIACCKISPDPRGNLGTICEILRQPNVQLRRKAAEAAGRVCTSAAQADLARVNDDAFKAAFGPDNEPHNQADREKAWLDELPDSRKIKAALVAALSDSDAEVRSHVAETFSVLGSAAIDAKPILANLLQDPSAEVRANAASALGSLGPPARDTESRMLALLNDSNLLVRFRAIAALRKIGAEPKLLLEPLLRMLDAAEKDVRREAGSALGDILARADKLSDEEFKEVFFALIRKALQDQDEIAKSDPSEFIQLAHDIPVDHLWHVDTKVVQIIIPTLVEKLNASSGRTRKLWTKLLADVLYGIRYALLVREEKDVFLGPRAGRSGRAAIQAAVPVLLDDMNSPDKSVRDSATRALASIGPEAKAAVLELGRRLKSKDKRNFLESNFSLRLFGPDAEAAVPVLIDLIRSDDLDFQVPAVISLGVIGPAAKDAVPALLAVIRDQQSEDSLALHSASALFQINRATALGTLQEKINVRARRQLEQLIASTRRFDPKP